MNHLPTITVIIATYNSQNTIHDCLKSVRDQNYPQEKIDIILADGGSKDNTFQIVKKFDVTILQIPKELQNAEYNKGVAFRKAKGELVLMIDHDNELPHIEWLQKMIRPLLKDPEIIASETLYYHYDPKFPLIDRYFALFGAGDPLAYYLGKADRQSYITKGYALWGNAKDCGNYYKVKFSKDKIPTLGANGFLVRRKIMFENAMVDDHHFFHIDVNVDLIKKGFNTYAFVDDSIIHHTGYKSISNFLYRRRLYMKQYHINVFKNRRYSVYMKGDTAGLLKYILYSATFIKPTYDAIRGYVKIHDRAWFVHPILCFALLMIYGSVTIQNAFVHND